MTQQLTKHELEKKLFLYNHTTLVDGLLQSMDRIGTIDTAHKNGTMEDLNKVTTWWLIKEEIATVFNECKLLVVEYDNSWWYGYIKHDGWYSKVKKYCNKNKIKF